MVATGAKSDTSVWSFATTCPTEEAGDVWTPPLLALVRTCAAPDRVELAWFAPARDVASAVVYRRAAGEEWAAIGRVWADGTGSLVYEDTHVSPGIRYGYRLGVTEAGEEVLLGETWVEVPAGTTLALAGLRTNPAEDLRAVFSLPDAAPARLELYDVGGRRIASREVGGLGAGSHVVPLGDGRTVAPGVYVLRLTRGGRSLTARGVILR